MISDRWKILPFNSEINAIIENPYRRECVLFILTEFEPNEITSLKRAMDIIGTAIINHQGRSKIADGQTILGTLQDAKQTNKSGKIMGYTKNADGRTVQIMSNL